ncbi:hypothetical protein [Aureibacillus halotolerans]|uniref:ABC-2 family transporter n=1 Tax=Aureibacillus halotolerans TaxID=1508390 RepID=A0A4R6UAV2_9BACI|nr:hypothetical protein [Aureibacillus halotolerans]TDQ42996.1 hypothetical protein EV213_101428 [Aureibacillus halotolerans]
MAVFWHELKKQFAWKLVAIVVAFSALWYVLYVDFYFEYFLNGPNDIATHLVVTEAYEKYGKELNEEEFHELKNDYQRTIDEMDALLLSNEAFRKTGFDGYIDYRDREAESPSQIQLGIDYKSIYEQALGENGELLSWKIQSYQHMIEFYELEILERKLDHTSIFPYFIYTNYNTVIGYVVIMVLLSVFILAAPVYFRDKKERLLPLQFTSETGRRIQAAKAWAVTCMALVVTTLQLGLFFFFYFQEDVDPYLHVNLNSFIQSHLFLFDLTFIQYIVITIIGTYLLSLSAAWLAAIVSRFVASYLGLLGVLVPVATVMIVLANAMLMEYLFTEYQPTLLTVSLYAVLLLGSGIALITITRRDRSLDVR